MIHHADRWNIDRMSNVSKGMIVGSMGAAGLVAFFCVLDMILAVPFGGNIVFDILFLVASGTVLYMGYDAYRDQQ